MKKSVLAVAVIALAAVPAYAADLIVTEQAPVIMTDAGFDWTGLYAGLNAGYTTGQARAVGAVSNATTAPNFTGGLLGATVGINGQFDQFVLGLEGDLAWSGASGSTACSLAPALTCTGNLNWLGTVKGRAGVAFDQVLLFATAGLAAGGARIDINPAAPGITNTFSGTMIGWTVGGGVELAVTEAVSVKAEYNYFDLGGLQAPAGTLAGAEATNLSATGHIAKIGVNFHF